MDYKERQNIKEHLKRYGKKNKSKLCEAAKEVLFSENKSIKDLMKGIGNESIGQTGALGRWEGGSEI